MIKIWIDGSSSSNRSFGGWGAIIQLNDGTFQSFSGSLRNVSSTDAELYALLYSFEKLENYKGDVCIHSDCQSLIDALSGKIEGIESSVWKDLLPYLGSYSSLKAFWCRRKSTKGLSAAHYLANSARICLEMSTFHSESHRCKNKGRRSSVKIHKKEEFSPFDNVFLSPGFS